MNLQRIDAMEFEYQEHEFCRAVKCEDLYNQTDCVAQIDMECMYTAKELLAWLKENGYRIVKA